MSDFVEIGELVNLPHHKMIGIVIDKIYKKNDLEPLIIIVQVDFNMSRDIYHKDGMPVLIPDIISVTYDKIKSMKSTVIYNNRTIPLNIPNLLQKKDIKEGNIVKVVDNHMLEKMITYETNQRIFSEASIKDIVNKKAVLTGNHYGFGSWYNKKDTVEVKLKDGRECYIYNDCIQLIKRRNIFVKIRIFFNDLIDFFK